MDRQLLNFNDLPCDIKRMIFKMNKDRETAEFVRNKKRHEEFMVMLTERFEYAEICENLMFHWDYHYQNFLASSDEDN